VDSTGGAFTVDTVVARIKGQDGAEKELTLCRKWPVRRPIPEVMLRKRRVERLYPHEPMTTTTRIIDTFFPHRTGGDRVYPRPFRSRKNRFAEPYLAVFHRGYRDCDRLR